MGFGLILLGLAGLGIVAGFVLLLGLDQLPPRPELPFPWLVNSGWLVVFAVQHSGMARSGFKNWWTHIIPPELERPIYLASSGLLVAGLALTWQPLPGNPIWQGPVWLTGLALLGGLAAAALPLWTGWQQFLGLPALGGRSSPDQERLITTGPYGIVRHPQMLCLLVFLWAHPVMSPTLLFLSGGLTVYLLAALPLEEGELLRKYGKEYEEYRQRVWW